MVAIVAMLIIGALLTATFYTSAQEEHIGRNSLLQERAQAASEYGLHRVLNDWTTPTYAALITGANRRSDFSAEQIGAGASASVRITKLGPTVFDVVSDGFAGSGPSSLARRRTSLLVRLDVPAMSFLGALTVRDDAALDATSSLVGDDANPAAWNCPPLAASTPALVMPDTTRLVLAGCADRSCLMGAPRIAQSVSAGVDSTYLAYGSVGWADLAARADHSYGTVTISGVAPVASGSVCNTADSGNWGDPLSAGACASYFPVIYASGDLTVASGAGQGILLVAGDLRVSGGFQFFGPVIVRGRLTISGSGAQFMGGVMARRVDLQATVAPGHARIVSSRCAILTALAASAPPMRVLQRAWSDMD
jgi:hypothetical protein